MNRVYRQTGVRYIETLLKQAEDATHPTEAIFEDGILADILGGAKSFGVDPTEAQDKYIQQLRSIYDKYLAPFHGRDTATEKPPKVVSVSK